MGNMKVAIEAKATSRVTGDYLKGLRELKNDFSGVGERVVVCLERQVHRTEDGIWILPYAEFVARLWANPLVPDAQVRLGA